MIINKYFSFLCFRGLRLFLYYPVSLPQDSVLDKDPAKNHFL